MGGIVNYRENSIYVLKDKLMLLMVLKLKG